MSYRFARVVVRMSSRSVHGPGSREPSFARATASAHDADAGVARARDGLAVGAAAAGGRRGDALAAAAVGGAR